jgi:hypothetical protein
MSSFAEGTVLPTRVLLVRDGEASPATLPAALRAAGFEVIEAAGGPGLLAAAEVAAAPLAIIDLPSRDAAIFAAGAIRAHPALADLFLVVCHEAQDPLALTDTIDGVLDRALPAVVVPHLVRAFVGHAEARRLMRTMDPTTTGLAGAAQEIESLAMLGGGSVAAVAARSLGLLPLREAASAAFADLQKAYLRILDRAFEAHVLKTDTGITPRLRTLAEHLYFLRAGPRDVTDLHRAALQVIMDQEPPPRALGYVEAGRLIVLELMGHLLSQYRAHDLPTTRRRPAKPPASDVPPTT